MDLRESGAKLSVMVKKYRYVAVIILAGVLLMLLPMGTAEKKTVSSIKAEQVIPNMEERLAQILSKIEGAGRVSVMLTLSAGEEVIYQTDRKDAVSEGNSTTQSDTVIVTDGNRLENGLIIQVIPEKYQGAVIVCQGADKAAVRLAICEAVSKVTGLGTDKISVIKMK